jgi:uncharacterized protein (UPF0276 family)
LTIQLTTNYSDPLVELIHANETPVDGIEVGPWFTPQKIRQLQKEFPTWRFYFHAGGLMWRYRSMNEALARLCEYLSHFQDPWVSLHIELLPLHVYLLSSRLGLNLPPPKPESAINKILERLSQVKAALEVPIILENLVSLPARKYAYAALPTTIREIVASTDSGLLLDLAHARVAASYQGMEVERYLQKLPLERVRQIHVSGARVQRGYLYDAHESLGVEDYALLKWTLERTQPQIVTLEYIRATEALREQLRNLREIIAG